MDLSRLKPVYEHEGPFATVYMEGRAPGEDAGSQIRLRWKALRERLVNGGATSGALEAIDSALEREDPGEEQADGRVLVASASGMVLDEPWDAALGAGDEAHWSVVPELGALVREECRSVRMLVVIAEHQGAQLRHEVVAEQHVARNVETESVTGGDDSGTHKPRGGALSHKKIQRRAEQTLQRNADDVVAHVQSVEDSFRPRLLVLAGEAQGRTALRDALPENFAGMVADAERGDAQDEGGEAALAEQLREIAERESARTAASRAEQLNAGLAHGQAVHGADAVAKAAEMGAVETLLFEHESAGSREAMLIKTCAQTGSHADLVPDGTGLADGVGALLRFPVQG